MGVHKVPSNKSSKPNAASQPQTLNMTTQNSDVIVLYDELDN